jgi:fructokinase
MSKQTSARTAKRLTVVGLGESLFDCLDERIVLGGAPLNLAVHAHRLLSTRGGCGMVVSRVGTDELGDRLIHELEERGLETSLIQRDSAHPTGTVQVTFDQDGHPDYSIARDVAWDYIELSQGVRSVAAGCSAVCFGTLAQRSETSRRTIQEFLTIAQQAIRLYDVNLRKGSYTAEIIGQSLAAANVAKLNEQELPQVCELIGVAANLSKDPDGQAGALRQAFDLNVLALTRGEAGTVLYAGGQRLEAKPGRFPSEPGADSVGAGDACGAGLICGLLLEWPLQDTLTLANQMGAYVASRRGATPPLSDPLLEMLSSTTG